MQFVTFYTIQQYCGTEDVFGGDFGGGGIFFFFKQYRAICHFLYNTTISRNWTVVLVFSCFDRTPCNLSLFIEYDNTVELDAFYKTIP